MNSITKVPHPIYFLKMKRTKTQDRASLTAIKDEHTGERFVCVFLSPQDTEEFMVANDLTFDTWKISRAHSPGLVQGHCYDAVGEGICEAVINPPPSIRGLWRTLSIDQLAIWSRKAEEPLLVWAGYKASPAPHNEAKKQARKDEKV